MSGWNRFFHITERGSSIKTEILGGVVTYLAMAYIIFVNPATLAVTGMDYNAVLIATCIASAIGCLLTAFIANLPFAQAPGMGLNTFFTYTLCLAGGYTWQQSLAVVFISGLIFLAIMLTPLRYRIIDSIPAFLKSAISAGIGLFIAFLGLSNTGIIEGFGNGTGFYTELGDITHGAPLLGLVGIAITLVLVVRKVKGAIFIGIVVTTMIGIPMGITEYTPMDSSVGAIGQVLGKLSFTGLTANGVLPLITAIISFCMIDMFDTAGALVGTAGNSGLSDERGNVKGGERIMVADALATCVGAWIGTSTVTTYIESTVGIQEGARTGLSNVVVGMLFLLSCFIAPLAGIIPSAATSPALIIVGVYMMGNTAKIDWSSLEQAVPAFFTIAIMPFSYSISNGIGFGFISYIIVKAFIGKAKEVPLLMYVIAGLYAAMYILSGI